MSLFRSDENPNDLIGGAGCLCHPRGADETRGPFYTFTATTTDDNLSPHAVLCQHCADHACLAVADPEPVEAEIVEAEPTKVIPI